LVGQGTNKVGRVTAGYWAGGAGYRSLRASAGTTLGLNEGLRAALGLGEGLRIGCSGSLGSLALWLGCEPGA
jgi:hypothetical protein